MTLPSCQTSTMAQAVDIDVQTTSRAYHVHVGEGLVDRLDDLLTSAGATGQRFVISDSGVVVVPRDYQFNSLVPPPKPKRLFEPPPINTRKITAPTVN